MTKKKKIIFISAGAAVVLILLIIIWFFVSRKSSSSADGAVAYTTPVSMLTTSTTGMVNRYAGVVEPQKTVKIQKASDKNVKEVFVKEGDTVTKGAPLFAYDTDEIQMKLSEAELELERIGTEISTLYNQIETLQAEKEKAPESEVFSYTTQILTAQNDVKRAEYNQKSKGVEIEQIRKSLENATVTSEIDGIVKSINDGTQNSYGYDNDSSYMTILSNNEYRIKGTINEQNMYAISTGQEMLVHSRIDEDLVWRGTVTEVDTENPVSNQNNMYISSGSDTNTTSSSYNFYVELSDEAVLMLGQHVFMEPDVGQNETKEGLWLSSYYLVFDGNDAYAWVCGKNDKLEKRKITTGQHDETMDEYEITSGLTPEDAIAFPDDTLTEGMPCVNAASQGDADMSGSDMGGADMGGADMNAVGGMEEVVE
ncbi:biotin/lipoyl-binding protein [Frisingicoccus sp.]|uniref:biotin/lipoyl-binding protein n=1 Tax=Frisingicoccus sp. TaxID=1918627 RepID=UPI003AB9034B